jgi:hypothetical protein
VFTKKYSLFQGLGNFSSNGAESLPKATRRRCRFASNLRNSLLISLLAGKLDAETGSIATASATILLRAASFAIYGSARRSCSEESS